MAMISYLHLAGRKVEVPLAAGELFDGVRHIVPHLHERASGQEWEEWPVVTNYICRACDVVRSFVDPSTHLRSNLFSTGVTRKKVNNTPLRRDYVLQVAQEHEILSKIIRGTCGRRLTNETRCGKGKRMRSNSGNKIDDNNSCNDSQARGRFAPPKRGCRAGSGWPPAHREQKSRKTSRRRKYGQLAVIHLVNPCIPRET